jgi:hypothetical protein
VQSHVDVAGATQFPSPSPSKAPTKSPSKAPTKSPSKAPTKSPTTTPTKAPTEAPTQAPTQAPTKAPTTPAGTASFTLAFLTTSTDFESALAQSLAAIFSLGQSAVALDSGARRLIAAVNAQLDVTLTFATVSVLAAAMGILDNFSAFVSDLESALAASGYSVTVEGFTDVQSHVDVAGATQFPSPSPTKYPTLAPTKAPTLAPTKVSVVSCVLYGFF